MVPYLPVEDIEGPVQPQQQNVTTCDVLNPLMLSDHGQLRQDCQSLKPNAVTPDQVEEGEGPMDYESQNCCGEIEEIVREFIRLPVITQAKGLLRHHEVDRIESHPNENQFHQEEVDTLPA